MKPTQNAAMDDTPPPQTRAVALADGADGPQLVAKGRGALAEQILALAFEHGVKVRQDAALTEILETFDLESPIPAPALDAVAAVLAHVYAATHQP